MITAEFFNDVLPRQAARDALGSFRTLIHLASGPVYTVESICDVTDAFVVVSVYPEGGIKGKAREDRCPYKGAEPRLDRIAIPYGDILRVEMTVTEPDRNNDENRGSFGFHAAGGADRG